MSRIVLVLVVLGVAAGAAAWFTPEGLTDDLLRMTVGLDGVILAFIGLIAGLQWASDRFTTPV